MALRKEKTLKLHFRTGERAGGHLSSALSSVKHHLQVVHQTQEGEGQRCLGARLLIPRPASRGPTPHGGSLSAHGSSTRSWRSHVCGGPHVPSGCGRNCHPLSGTADVSDSASSSLEFSLSFFSAPFTLSATGLTLITGGRLEGNQGRANYSKDNEKSLTIFLKKQTNNPRIIIFAFIADEKKCLFYINPLFP